MSIEILRQHAMDIFQAALTAADPQKAIDKFVHVKKSNLYVGNASYNLEAYSNIYVVGGGKAGASMSQAVEQILGRHITEGLINVKYGHLLPTRRIKLNEAGHPVPDEAGAVGTRRILDILAPLTEKDLVLCLLSGGGSSLLAAPAQEVTLEQKQQVTQQLLRCGAAIQEINTIRKHISAVKGGQLSQIAWPATVITLLVSDVIGDPLDVIASGPTAPDTSTFEDCMAVLRKYDLVDTIPWAILNRIEQGINGQIPETPKPGCPVLSRTQNLIIASNSLAVEAAARKAKELHYNTHIISTCIDGETRHAAKTHTDVLRQVLCPGKPINSPACILSGGETTVTIQGNGLGGRNQEFVLAAAMEMEGLENAVVFSGGTDGTDGPTDAAGAIADGRTIARARTKRMDPNAYLQDNDSYHFFEMLGDLIKTGPTHTNVMDLHILLTAAHSR